MVLLLLKPSIVGFLVDVVVVGFDFGFVMPALLLGSWVSQMSLGAMVDLRLFAGDISI